MIKQIYKVLMNNIKVRLIRWCLKDDKYTYGDIFNSLRINALIDEMTSKKIIVESEYNDRIMKSICSIIGEV